MPYIPYEWHDGSGGGTPLTALRLNTIENGIAEATELAESIPPLLEDFATTDMVLPGGGASGQVLTKTSPASYDVEWRTPETYDPPEPGDPVVIQAPAGPIASLRNTTQRAIPYQEFTAVRFESELIDTHNGHSTSTNTDRYTIPSGWAGYYEISGTAAIGHDENNYVPGGRRGARLLINGNSTTTRMEHMGASAFAYTAYTAYAIVQLAVGDYIQLQAYHSNDTYVHTWVSPGVASNLYVKWLRAA